MNSHPSFDSHFNKSIDNLKNKNEHKRNQSLP